MATMMHRLSQKIKRKGSKVIEIDVGKDVKVVNVNPEEILVDFPNRRSSFNTQEEKNDLIEDEQWELAISNLSLGTGQMSDNEDDDGDQAFLGFPEGGRKPSMCTKRQVQSHDMDYCTADEAFLSRMCLPTTIMFPRSRVQESHKMTESRPQAYEGQIVEEASVSHTNQAEVVENITPLVEETIVLEEEVKPEEFERPSNWVTHDDDDSDSCNSEEYRQNIMRMARERNAAEEASASPEPEPEEATALPQIRRLPKRSLARRQSHRSCTSRNDRDAETNNEKNPFSGGFDFAKKEPTTRPKFGRRQSLTNIKYAFEENVSQQPKQPQPPQPRRRQQRRASMGAFDAGREYADGLKAFGAKSHDIHTVLY